MVSNFIYIDLCAGVVKLVDARDSKSREPQAHVGSIPTSGTKLLNFDLIIRVFSLLPQRIPVLAFLIEGVFHQTFYQTYRFP